MKLFGDSSAWLAFFDQYQPQHETVRHAVGLLSRHNLVIYVTDYVIDETLTLIMNRVSHSVAINCGEWLLRSPFVRVVRLDELHWNSAWDLFRRYDDRDFSFTDCTSFVIMQSYNLADVFSFDHHFEQMGFRLWPR